MSPLHIAFVNLQTSQAVQDAVVEQASRLERIFGRILDCRVILSSDHKHRSSGRTYRVNIALRVPGKSLVVNREPGGRPHADIYAAIRDAFRTLERQLEDYTRRLHGRVKTHAS